MTKQEVVEVEIDRFLATHLFSISKDFQFPLAKRVSVTRAMAAVLMSFVDEPEVGGCNVVDLFNKDAANDN